MTESAQNMMSTDGQSDSDSIAEMAVANHHRLNIQQQRTIRDQYRTAPQLTQTQITDILRSCVVGDSLAVVWAFPDAPRTILRWSGTIVVHDPNGVMIFYAATNPSMPHLADPSAGGMVEQLPSPNCIYYNIEKLAMVRTHPAQLQEAILLEANEARARHLRLDAASKDHENIVKNLTQEITTLRAQVQQSQSTFGGNNFVWFDPATWDEKNAETILLTIRTQLGITQLSPPSQQLHFGHIESLVVALDNTNWCSNQGLVVHARGLLRALRDSVSYAAGVDMNRLRRELADTLVDPYEAATMRAGKYERKPTQRQRTDGTKKCYLCGTEGHIANMCPRKKPPPYTAPKNQQPGGRQLNL